ncbi:hypothetical protein M2175_001263 [Bradyrhizobium elkanii]|uniref:hypothetical protein n=1 Tax=Bradyrhizobium TaxID=374 RepID=UPI002166C3AB|nr:MULTISPECIES: hypothetical protein [Bradyrhizobium]MCS3926232.1 hypothetical protein [Bradyrhizobium elkanii]MCS3966785.1 hypothetical protein [Bradyrhizobium japonicum]
MAGWVKPSESLPHYEDVLLGSLGRLADHMVLLKSGSNAFTVSRTGRYAREWLSDERWDIPIEALPPDCATVVRETGSNATTVPISAPRIVCELWADRIAVDRVECFFIGLAVAGGVCLCAVFFLPMVVLVR